MAWLGAAGLAHANHSSTLDSNWSRFTDGSTIYTNNAGGTGNHWVIVKTGASSGTYRAVIRFNPSALSGTVKKVELQIQVGASVASHTANIWPINNEPSAATAANLNTDAADDVAGEIGLQNGGAAFVSGWTGYQSTGIKTVDLGSGAVSSLQAAIDAARTWWAVGLESSTSNGSAALHYGYGDGTDLELQPNLIVTFTSSYTLTDDSASSPAYPPAGIKEGDQGVAWMRVSAVATGLPAVTAITVGLEKTAGPATALTEMVTRVRIFVSGDKTFDSESDTLFGSSTSIPSGTSGTVAITGSFTDTTDNNTRFFIVVVDLASTAGGNTLEVEMSGNGSDFAHLAWTTTDSDSSSAHFARSASIADVTGPECEVLAILDKAASLTPTVPGTDTWIAIKIQARQSITLTGVKVRLVGSAGGILDTSVTGVSIYRSADDLYDGSDTQLGSTVDPGAFDSSGLDVSFSGFSRTETDALFYILVRITFAATAEAEAGEAVAVRLGTSDADTISSGDELTFSGSPTVIDSVSGSQSSSSRAIPAVLTVDGDGGQDYTTIQDAIDAIPAGSTTSYVVRVYAAAAYVGFNVDGKTTTPISIEGNGSDWPTVNSANTDDGAYINDSSAVTIKNMVFTGCGNNAGTYAIQATSSADNLTLKNLLIHNNNDAEIRIEGADNVTIENCTVFDDDSVRLLDVTASPVSTGHTLKNNIFMSTVDLLRIVAFIAATDVAASNFNCFYDPGVTGLIQAGGTDYSLAGWQGVSGKDGSSLDSNPQFVTDGSDYHLKSRGAHPTGGPPNTSWGRDGSTNSPCIDAGDPTSSYSNETEDNGNRIDMGAFGNTDQASRSYDGIVPTYGTNSPLTYNYWMGTSTGTWSTSNYGNWSQGVPLTGDESRGRVRIDPSNTLAALSPSPGPNLSPTVTDTSGSIVAYSLAVYSGTLTLSSGVISVREGGVTISGGTLTFSGTPTLRNRGGWTATGGTFAPSVGTVEWDGSAAYSATIKPYSSHNFPSLTVSNASASLSTASDSTVTVSVTGTLTVAGTLILDRDDTLSLSGTSNTGHSVSGTLKMKIGTTTGGPTQLKIGSDSAIDFTSTSTFEVDDTPETPSFETTRDATPTEPKRYVKVTRAGASGGWGIRCNGTIKLTYVRFEYVKGTENATPAAARFPFVIKKTAAMAGTEYMNNIQWARMISGADAGASENNGKHNKYLLLVNASPSASAYGETPSVVDMFPHTYTDGVKEGFKAHFFDIPGPAPSVCYHCVQKNAAGDTVVFDRGGGSMAGDVYDLDGDSASHPVHGADTDYPSGIWPGLDDIGNPGVTSVTLSAYGATGYDRAVDVTWETGVELRNIGFNVLRAIRPTGPFVQMNRSLILGQGDTWGGGKYLFRDIDVQNGVTYYYLIQDVEYDGSVRSHGPTSATPTAAAGAPPAIVAANYFSTGQTQPEATSPGPFFPGSPSPSPTPAPDRPGSATGQIETSGPARGVDLRLAGIRVVHSEPGRVVIEIVPPKLVREQVKLGSALFDIVRMGGYGLVERPGWPLVPETTISLALPGATNPRWRTLRADPVFLSGFRMLWRAGDPEAGDPLDPSADPPDDGVVGASPGAGLGRAGALAGSGLPLAEIEKLRAEMMAAVREERASIMSAIAAGRKGRILGAKAPVAAVVRRALALRRLAGPGPRGDFLPPPIQLGALAQAGGERLLPVTIHPVEYAPTSGTLKVYRQHLVEIRYDIEGDTTPTAAEQDAQLAAALASHWRLSTAAGAAKIAVSRDGIYRVTQVALAAAGFDTAQDPRTYQLFHRGIEVPIRVAGEDDGTLDPSDFVEFAGFRNLTRHSVTGESLYSDTSVYWLVGGRAANGLRVPPMDATPTGAAPEASHTATGLHNDQKIHFGTMAWIGPGHDYWFTTALSTTGPPVSKFFATSTPGRIASGTATLELRIYGRSRSEAVNPDHHLQVKIGGTIVADVTWDGTGPKVVTATFDASLLTDGTTSVEGRLPADLGLTELNYVDYVKISYPRGFGVASNALAFPTAAAREVVVTGLPDGTPVAWLMRSGRPAGFLGGLVTTLNGATYDSRLNAGPGDVWIAGGSGILAPDSVTLDTPNSYPSTANGADWVAISHPSFVAGLATLVAHRAGQGHRTFVADVTEVYDSFSFGEFDPAAIQRFLRHAYARWARPRPRHALLVGDATFDYKDYLARGGMFVPTYMVPTVYYRTASDNWFACVDGADDLPDIAIGRLPVRTAAQLAVWTTKLIGNDTSPDLVQKKVLFVADNADVADFPAENAELATLLPADFAIEHANYPDLSPTAIRDRVIARINDGVLLIHYNGHGAIQQWAQERLLHNADEPLCANSGKYPVVMVNNCLSGAFADASLTPLAETYTQTADRGALAFFASTSLNTPWGQHLLSTETYKLLTSGVTELGPLVTAAKVRVGALGGGGTELDVIRSWVLIGDPATRLAWPR